MPRPLPVEFCFNVTSARAGSARLSERTVVMNASFILNTSGEWESSIPLLLLYCCPEARMKRYVTVCFAAVTLALWSPAHAQSKAKAQNVPDIPYESVSNFLKFPPNVYLGEGIGVATNSKGHVFVYTRSGDTRLFEFDQNGAFVREIGQGLYGFVFAHAVRVDKYDKNGRFIKSAGTRGNQQGQLNLPHTIATDAQGNVYIGDRSNARVQVWDNDLNFKAIYDQVGSPWAVCISPGPHQYLFVSNSVPDNGDSRAAAQTGEIYKMELDGTIVGKFGKAGKALKEFSTVHEIDCRNPNELFVSEITDWRVQKIILRPQGGTSNGK